MALSFRTVTFAVAAILACGAGGAIAGEHKVAGMTITMPDGYEVRVTGDGVTAQRKGERGGGILLAARQPSGAGTPAAMIERFRNGLSVKIEEDKPLVVTDGVTYRGAPMRHEYWCCDGRIAGEFAAIAAPEASVLFAFIDIDLDRDTSRAMRQEFAAMVRTARLFPADRGFVLVPGPGAGGLDGLYTRMDTGLRPNTFGGLDFYADMQMLFFDPSGLYSDEPPTRLPLAVACRSTPEDCGTYALTGGWFAKTGIERLEPVGALGMFRREVETFAREGETLTIDGQDWTRVEPVSDLVLDGVWNWSHASSGSSAFSSGSIASWRSLTFRKDGSFTREGGVATSNQNESGGNRTSIVTGSTRPVMQGRYAIDGYLLTLIDADGASERLSFVVPDPADLDLLIINGANYLRR